jgi:MFS family permease
VPSARTAWLVVALLVPVALLNYLDRQMLATMKASVMADIPSIESDARWGRMLGQFKWVYAALSPFGGYVADRFGRRVTIGASLFVWSGVTLWTGRVTDYGELTWARSLMGFSEAFYMPAALALIADYHRGNTRSKAIGVHHWGIYLGQIVGGFGGYAADYPDLGWRGALTVCGAVGMTYAIPLALVLRDAPTEESPIRPSPVDSVATLFSNVSFLLLVLYFTLPALAGWIVRDWMPAILKETFGLGQGKAGVAATVYWQAAAIVGVILGGAWADTWVGRTPRGRLYVSAVGMCLIAPAIIGIGFATSVGAAVGCLVVFGLGWGFFDGNNMPILAQIVRPEYRATGYGIMNFVSISCGGLADWGFGILRDRKVPLDVIFGLFGMAAIASIGLVLLIRPKTDS